MRFEVVDRCPVPRKVAPHVTEAKRRSGQWLNSCFRGKEARALLHRLGKMDQTQLWLGWLRRLPGFNPANPPGRSTHECFNDGPAFPGRRVGARIPDELVGQDWTNAPAVVRAYRSMGVNAALTYPGSVREAQHVNIRKVPKRLRLPLERGDGRERGGGIRRRVRSMTHKLSYVATPHSGGKGRYLDGSRPVFDAETEKAVKRFQHDHGLTADGIVGEMTLHQLDVSYRHWVKRRHEQAPPPKPGEHKPPKPPKPPLPQPRKIRLKGVDVSEHQGDIDWKRVKHSGAAFAIVKATEGLDFEDHRFSEARVTAMREAGLTIGFYHFARPQPGRTGKQEAQHFIRVVKNAGGFKKGDLAPVLDIEWVQGLGQAQLRAWIRSFLRECKRQTGVRAIIYTGAWFWNPRTGNPRTGFGKHPLWLAAYVKNPAGFVPRAWKRQAIWQYTDKGRVAGIGTPVDTNVIVGTTDDLTRLRIR